MDGALIQAARDGDYDTKKSLGVTTGSGPAAARQERQPCYRGQARFTAGLSSTTMSAISNGDLAITQFLIESGAREKQGWTVLHLAEKVRLLLENGADVTEDLFI